LGFLQLMELWNLVLSLETMLPSIANQLVTKPAAWILRDVITVIVYFKMYAWSPKFDSQWLRFDIKNEFRLEVLNKLFDCSAHAPLCMDLKTIRKGA
jgi:hypothetical protein